MNPLEIDVFYRYTFLNQGSENIILWVPGHFYARIKEVRLISLFSCDLLCFVVLFLMNISGLAVEYDNY